MPDRPDNDAKGSDPDKRLPGLLRDLEPLVGEQRFLLFAAIIGITFGALLWGSVLFGIGSGVQNFVDGDDGDAGGGDGITITEVQEMDCDAFGSQRALSTEAEAAFQEQCLTPTPVPEQEQEPTQEPADASLNRESCNEIRGTDYRSPEERAWFLENCVDP